MIASETLNQIRNPKILDAARHGELVIFLGAGASMLCGSPDWRTFASRVVDILVDEKKLNFLEAEQLKGLSDPRRTLSIALFEIEKHQLSVDFRKILHSKPCEEAGRQLYGLIKAFGAPVVTTNYDDWLHTNFDTKETVFSDSEAIKPPEIYSVATASSIYYSENQFLEVQLKEKGAIFHLHGWIEHPDSMVISLKQYLKHYGSESLVPQFLESIFKHYTVLFIGYGLAELEILDYVVRSNKTSVLDNKPPEHFMLYGYRSTETLQKDYLTTFYSSQCGVQVIPYCIDKHGYAELVDVLQVISTELQIGEPALIDIQESLDRCLNEDKPGYIRSAINLLNKNPDSIPYFMNKVSDTKWFLPLYEAGFFGSRFAPKVSIVENESGTMFSAERWPALRYLSSVTPTVNEEDAKIIKSIVKEVDRNAPTEPVSNWRTIWGLAEVFSKLPVALVDDSDILMLKKWISADGDNSFAGREIGLNLLPRLLESNTPAAEKYSLNLIDSLISPRHSDTKAGQERSVLLDTLSISDVFQGNIDLLASRLDVEAVKVFSIRLMDLIGSKEEDEYSYIWRPAIEESAQNSRTDDPRSVLLMIVRDVALSLSRSDIEGKAKEVAEYLLCSNYETLQRIGIYICSENYSVLRDTFWARVQDKWFVDSAFWHEIYRLIQKNFLIFSTHQRQKLLVTLSALNPKGVAKKNRARWVEIQTRNLLSAAADKGDAEVDEIFIRLVRKLGPVPAFPEFLFYTSENEPSNIDSSALGRWTSASSDEIKRLFKDESFLASYFVHVDKTEVASSLASYLKVRPEDIRLVWRSLPKAPRALQHGFLTVLKELLESGNSPLSSDEIVTLIGKLVQSGNFKVELRATASRAWEPTVHWVIGDVINLIRSSLRHPEIFTAQHYPGFVQSVKAVIAALPIDENKECSDWSGQALNSSRGKCVSCLFDLAYSTTRDSWAGSSWSKNGWAQIQLIFEREFYFCEQGKNTDFAYLFAKNWFDLYKFDRDWIERNFQRILTTTCQQTWIAAVQGIAQRKIYDVWLFSHLMSGGHLKKMLDIDVESYRSISEAATQYIGLAYLNGDIELDDGSLLDVLISDLNFIHIAEICRFFWAKRNLEKRPWAARVIKFWLQTSFKLMSYGSSDTSTIHMKRLAASLSLLACYVEELSEEAKVVMKFLAPHVNYSHRGYLFIDVLVNLATSAPSEVLEIFRALLEGYTPDYRPEQVQKLVFGFAQSGFANEAEKICDEFVRRGSQLLSGCYKEIRELQRSGLATDGHK